MPAPLRLSVLPSAPSNSGSSSNQMSAWTSSPIPSTSTTTPSIRSSPVLSTTTSISHPPTPTSWSTSLTAAQTDLHSILPWHTLPIPPQPLNTDRTAILRAALLHIELLHQSLGKTIRENYNSNEVTSDTGDQKADVEFALGFVRNGTTPREARRFLATRNNYAGTCAAKVYDSIKLVVPKAWFWTAGMKDELEWRAGYSKCDVVVVLRAVRQYIGELEREEKRMRSTEVGSKRKRGLDDEEVSNKRVATEARKDDEDVSDDGPVKAPNGLAQGSSTTSLSSAALQLQGELDYYSSRYPYASVAEKVQDQVDTRVEFALRKIEQWCDGQISQALLEEDKIEDCLALPD